MSSPLRIGLVGASKIAIRSVLAPARVIPGIEVVAVSARDPSRAEAYAAEHGIGRVYASYAEMLRAPMPGPSGGGSRRIRETGAIQIVEARERVEEVALPAMLNLVVPEPAKGRAADVGAPGLFASLDDDALLSAGVPVDWLADVRAANEDGFFALAKHLPRSRGGL